MKPVIIEAKIISVMQYLMKIDYKTFIPAEIPDDVVYHLADLFYNLANGFNMHLVHTMLDEQTTIDGKVKPEATQEVKL